MEVSPRQQPQGPLVLTQLHLNHLREVSEQQTVSFLRVPTVLRIHSACSSPSVDAGACSLPRSCFPASHAPADCKHESWPARTCTVNHYITTMTEASNRPVARQHRLQLHTCPQLLVRTYAWHQELSARICMRACLSVVYRIVKVLNNILVRGFRKCPTHSSPRKGDFDMTKLAVPPKTRII